MMTASDMETETLTQQELQHESDTNVDDESKPLLTTESTESSTSSSPSSLPTVAAPPPPPEQPNMDIASRRRIEQEEAIQESTNQDSFDPVKQLKKGAKAVVGGTMVAVGLVMIPLPTPCGAIVAASGMSMLGSEFEQADELNQKMKSKAKKGLVRASKNLKAKIESMSSKSLDDDDDDNEEEEDNNTEQDHNNNNIILQPSISQDSQDDNDNDDDQQQPAWLHMNKAEQKRQEKIAKEKYRKETQSSSAQFKEQFYSKTSKYLSRTLVPLLDKTKQFEEEEEEETTTNDKEDNDKLTTNNIATTTTTTNSTIDGAMSNLTVEPKNQGTQEETEVEKAVLCAL